jgi:hypothetical protein
VSFHLQLLCIALELQVELFQIAQKGLSYKILRIMITRQIVNHELTNAYLHFLDAANFNASPFPIPELLPVITITGVLSTIVQFSLLTFTKKWDKRN